MVIRHPQIHYVTRILVRHSYVPVFVMYLQEVFFSTSILYSSHNGTGSVNTNRLGAQSLGIQNVEYVFCSPRPDRSGSVMSST
jgi:hypothetical protein